MLFFLATVFTLLAVVVDCAVGACSSWQTQINISMCNWQGLRANVLRDTIYLDGGHLWLQQGYSDGCVDYNIDGNLEGTIYYLNLSTPFSTSSDFMTVLRNTSIAGGAANNIAPNYVDGVMFANDDEFYLYGGRTHATTSSEQPSDNEVLGYEAYQYGPYRSSWTPGWHEGYLSTNVTRYITNGAGVSAPSENLGFYFSGMRAPDWGYFSYSYPVPNKTADTLITVDMSVMRDEKWYNNTLPSYVPGRANAELVWVPVSDSGVLVAIGGVVNPVEIWRSGLKKSQTAESKRVSPTFMDTVSVYDVKSQTWYLQNTTGDTPPQLTQFCSVLASAADGSSHNIYIYGGYSGLVYDENASDDVYILSLPSFKWIKAYSGTNTHGRVGHRCIKVYPDQMLALGGMRIDSTHCLEDGVVVNFNLNSLRFEDYDPTQWGEYQVPDIVTAEIGGSSSGGATTTAPSSWTNTSLAGMFDKKYSKTIETYWPYNNGSSTTGRNSKSGGLPTWAAAVIGVLCGLFGIALLAVGFWLYRRRRNQRRTAPVAATTESDTKEKPQWMYSGEPTSPSPGPVSESTGVETTQDSALTSVTPGTVESGGDEVYELHDSSPVELPTQFNVPRSTPSVSPQLGPVRDSHSPVSLHTRDESDSGHSYPSSHYRRPSSLSIAPSFSIDNVVTGRTSYFQESFDNENMQRPRHRSEISDASVSSDERGRVGGSETIHEHES